ncbi:MAG: GNAT family N-acetyltransferase [Clostridia bacterium]|jgi:ribosomal protein S18 acetylase RimI-like enzyme|nr:GNAT family N-acetyltransferase [Clostridia bacterium]MBT7122471.1 GNAT family N-acetyltransferase [Clostridia bacterium]
MNTIQKITADKYDYMDLLLIADPSEKAIAKYLGDSDLFVMFEADKPVCVAVVKKVSDNICEIKNIAVTKMRRGYGSEMIDYICDYYKNNYEFMEVGTADTSIGNIRFYERNGFAVTHQIDNFFVDNYDEPIYENGVQCRHMVMLQRSLDE